MLEDEQVPGIPQEVRLFGEDKHAEPQRKEALLEWFRDEMREDESVLVLCRGAPTAKSLFRDPVFKEIDGGTQGAVEKTDFNKMISILGHGSGQDQGSGHDQV